MGDYERENKSYGKTLNWKEKKRINTKLSLQRIIRIYIYINNKWKSKGQLNVHVSSFFLSMGRKPKIRSKKKIKNKCVKFIEESIYLHNASLTK